MCVVVLMLAEYVREPRWRELRRSGQIKDAQVLVEPVIECFEDLGNPIVQQLRHGITDFKLPARLT